MKTRLLKKLRKEASDAFKFTILVEKRFGSWAEVRSFGKPVYFTCDGIRGANRFVRLVINRYILDRVKEIRLK